MRSLIELSFRCRGIAVPFQLRCAGRQSARHERRLSIGSCSASELAAIVDGGGILLREVCWLWPLSTIDTLTVAIAVAVAVAVPRKRWQSLRPLGCWWHRQPRRQHLYR